VKVFPGLTAGGCVGGGERAPAGGVAEVPRDAAR